jgi:Phasin protein
MKNGTKSPHDKRRKTKKQKEANENAPIAKAHQSEAKTVSEAKPVMRVQAAAPMPPAKAAVAPKPVKAAPAPKAEVKTAPKTEVKAAPKPNGKSKKDAKKDAKKASKPAKSRPAVETAPLMSAFKPPFAVPSFAMPKAMMPQSLAEAGQGALAVNRKLVEMAQANVRSGLDFAMRLAEAKTPMEFMSLQMSYWQERMGTFSRQAEELRKLAGGSCRYT